MPPVNNLITFGSQHMGVSDIPACRRYDFLCQMARRAAKGAVYSEWAQENVIQVNIFRLYLSNSADRLPSGAILSRSEQLREIS